VVLCTPLVPRAAAFRTAERPVADPLAVARRAAECLVVVPVAVVEDRRKAEARSTPADYLSGNPDGFPLV
jgi:hypothetical protein